MWTERFTVYYSKDRHYAVRWLRHGRPEDEAHFKTFGNRSDAEAFYNQMVQDQGESPACRVELYFSQSKWVMFHANRDEFGDPVATPLAEDTPRSVWFGNPADW